MSVKVDLYNAVVTRLETLTFLKNVLHYNGQELYDYEQDHSKRFPQAWVQLSNITWKQSEKQPNNSNRTQQQKSDECVITIFYASYSLNDDDDTFVTDLGNVDLIYRALTMMDSTNFTPLQRVAESDTATNNNVRIWVQQYSTMLTEQAISGTDVDAAPVDLTVNKTFLL